MSWYSRYNRGKTETTFDVLTGAMLAFCFVVVPLVVVVDRFIR